jgi:hypothetical protein
VLYTIIRLSIVMNAMRAVIAFVDELGIEAPAEFQSRLDNLLQNTQLASYDGIPPPIALAAAWRCLLDLDNSGTDRESLERLGLIGVLFDLTEECSPQLYEAFSETHLNLTRSRIEMAIRLGGRLYMKGRTYKLERNAANDGIRLLRAAIWYFNRAADYESWLQPLALRKLLGMRGVAQLLLARAGLDLNALPQAADDLHRSKGFGDTSVQNLVYRRECSIRLYDSLRTPSVLQALEDQLNEGGPHDHQYWSDLAKAHQYRANRLIDLQEGDPLPHLSAGIAACDTGLGIAGEDDSLAAVFCNLRGFLRFQSAMTARLDRDEAERALGLAIVDLRRAAAAGLGGASLPQALLRRSNLLKATDLAGARRDLKEALDRLALAEEELRDKLHRQISASLLDCTLREALTAEDWKPVPETCLRLLTFPEEVGWHSQVLLHALRAAWASLVGRAADSLVAATQQAVSYCVGLLEAGVDEEENIRLGVLLGYAAGLSRRLDSGGPSQRTLDLFREAISRQPMAPAALFGQAADTALQAGKHCAKLGEAHNAEEFFADSVKWYEAALTAAGLEGEDLPESFIPVVCHSKAGEAYLRLRCGSLGPDVVLERAIQHFEAARTLGNETPELLGLLGDAHYRIGYQTGNALSLRTALELKLGARAGGHLTRENYSVVARIYHRLFELEGDSRLLACAIESAVQAYDISPAWPWPLFQMAELSLCPSKSRLEAVSHLEAPLPEREQVGWILNGNRKALLEAAIHCAVAAVEFDMPVLGGRSRVFILDDPHRLLSTTLVIKPSQNPANAKQEMRTIAALGAHLKKKGLGGELGLPTPIALVERGGKFYYAMERARADGLDRRILGDDGRGYQGQPDVIRALDFLALFHAWADGGPRAMRPDRDLHDKFASYVRNLGGGRANAIRLSQDFASLIPSLPMARKCDAHPENWLVQPRGRIIMIDLEAKSHVPCLLDVAQLLDDYPVFPADVNGWRFRLELCADYWLKAMGIASDPQVIEAAYTALALFRCAFGLDYCAREICRRSASSALRALELRNVHYENLLVFLATHGVSARARRLAADLCELQNTSIKIGGHAA